MTALGRDVRVALRTLRRSPLFTTSVVVTLALGMGATLAMFVAFNAVLLRPLPYRDSDRLVRVRSDLPGIGLQSLPLSAPEFLRYRAESRTLTDIAIYQVTEVALDRPEGAIPVRAVTTTANLNSILRISVEAGRFFRPDEERTGAPSVAIISHELWQRQFGGDPAVIGSTLRLSGRPYELVGIQRRGTKFPASLGAREPDIWLPMQLTSDQAIRWGHRIYSAIARLRDETSGDAAAAELAHIGRAFAAEYPAAYQTAARWQPVVTFVDREARGDIGPLLAILLGAAALLLTIACVNVANLLSARGVGRRRDIAVRVALGARRRQIIQQFLVESLLLSGGGAVLGTLTAGALLGLMRNVAGGTLPWLSDVTGDWRALVFVSVTAILIGVGFGIAPALSGAQVSPGARLKDAGRSASSGRGQSRFRSALLATEIAVAVILLCGAGLLVRSFVSLIGVDLGFNPDRTLTMTVTAPASRFSDTTAARALYRNVFDQILSLPGVEMVSGVSELPLTGGTQNWGFRIEGRAAGSAPDPSEQVRIVAPDYFRTMGMRIVKGRDIGTRDVAGVPRVVVVNEAFARRHWPGQDALGQRISYVNGPAGDEWATVVGIVADFVSEGLDQPVRPEYYVPLFQDAFAYRSTQLVVRTAPGYAIADPIRRAVLTIDPLQTIRDIESLSAIVATSVAQRRTALTIMVSFGVVAFILAGIGVFGVTAVVIRQQTKDLGIRIALGASGSQVKRLVIGNGLVIGAIGVGAGLAFGAGLVQLLRSQLYGVEALDPMTFGIAALAAMLMTAVASYIPAVRATRIDPLDALRSE